MSRTQVTAHPRACIMGHPVAHSRSPMLHGYWLRTLGIAGSYEFADVAPEHFGAFFRGLAANGFVGGNVTIPHKEAAFRLVDRRERAADTIGAVNTVWYEDGMLVGGNTDWRGVVESLDDIHPGWDASPGCAVVLGAGGSARASVFAFLERRFSVAIVNRTVARAEKIAAEFGARVSAHGQDALPHLLGNADVLINNTSLGQAKFPPLEIDLGPLKSSAIVYDAVYVPLETELLKTAKRSGHLTVDGLSMLLYQAVVGFSHWFGVTPKVTAEQRALLEADIRQSC
ncbi:MAG: shikimate dehydrogenase [Hyphomicrobiales bacterium]|jgi:shikimate dehydrogenase|nr:shikimate dehydrogenase [Hyphomicrobiales bacterium]